MLLCVIKFKTMQFWAKTSIKIKRGIKILYCKNKILLNYEDFLFLRSIFSSVSISSNAVNKTTASQDVTRRRKSESWCRSRDRSRIAECLSNVPADIAYLLDHSDTGVANKHGIYDESVFIVIQENNQNTS